MEVNLGQNKGVQTRGGKIAQGATVVSAQLKKETKFINRQGDQIDPVSKKVIKSKIQDV